MPSIVLLWQTAEQQLKHKGKSVQILGFQKLMEKMFVLL